MLGTYLVWPVILLLLWHTLKHTAEQCRVYSIVTVFPIFVRHLSVVTQEFSLKVDKSLVVSICELMEPLLTSPTPTAIHAELKALKTPVSFQTMQVSLIFICHHVAKKNIFVILHMAFPDLFPVQLI